MIKDHKEDFKCNSKWVIRDISNKQYFFLQFNIKKFYPSIVDSFLDDVLNLTKQFAIITKEKIALIKPCHTYIHTYIHVILVE